MTLFVYDKTFDGILSCVFFAYEHRIIPDDILSEQFQIPLFIDNLYHVKTEKEKAWRVWSALEKKLSRIAQNMVLTTWLSELPEIEMLLFRYICKIIDHPKGYEMNFGDAGVIRIKEITQKVHAESERLIQFIRFQKTADDIYFSPVSPRFNVLSLIAPHFKSRYADQQWIIYDVGRNTGVYYDRQAVCQISFSLEDLQALKQPKLDDEKLSEEELFFQKMWKQYFRSTTIRERINLKLQRQHMPKRYWKFMTEMQ
ncbi:DNA metabolism protein [Porphyromonas macacae]|uniref:DNA metabolism protein n=1 Tax=Porphyromonas macacae TaxID=28115 RepID=A0A0A2EDG8_9PORP|nr:TIGR03915 family putative DNA repair protein [Porphyromonas macacae]KGN74484.1 DNA metabolism protein [Porphyromonas macacae]